jgi:hypothetical protein
MKRIRLIGPPSVGIAGALFENFLEGTCNGATNELRALVAPSGSDALELFCCNIIELHEDLLH